MKQMKKVVVVVLALVLCMAVLTGCSVNKSPQSVAKAYVAASASMDYDKMLKCMDTSSMTKEQKDAGKALVELGKSMMSEDAKAEAKSHKFKSYEKVSGTDTTEIGKVTIAYKKDGKGDAIEKTTTVPFIKIDGKWYVGVGVGSLFD